MDNYKNFISLWLSKVILKTAQQCDRVLFRKVENIQKKTCEYRGES